MSSSFSWTNIKIDVQKNAQLRATMRRQRELQNLPPAAPILHDEPVVGTAVLTDPEGAMIDESLLRVLTPVQSTEDLTQLHNSSGAGDFLHEAAAPSAQRSGPSDSHPGLCHPSQASMPSPPFTPRQRQSASASRTGKTTNSSADIVTLSDGGQRGGRLHPAATAPVPPQHTSVVWRSGTHPSAATSPSHSPTFARSSATWIATPPPEDRRAASTPRQAHIGSANRRAAPDVIHTHSAPHHHRGSPLSGSLNAAQSSHFHFSSTASSATAAMNASMNAVPSSGISATAHLTEYTSRGSSQRRSHVDRTPRSAASQSYHHPHTHPGGHGHAHAHAHGHAHAHAHAHGHGHAHGHAHGHGHVQPRSGPMVATAIPMTQRMYVQGAAERPHVARTHPPPQSAVPAPRVIRRGGGIILSEGFLAKAALAGTLSTPRQQGADAFPPSAAVTPHRPGDPGDASPAAAAAASTGDIADEVLTNNSLHLTADVKRVLTEVSRNELPAFKIRDPSKVYGSAEYITKDDADQMDDEVHEDNHDHDHVDPANAGAKRKTSHLTSSTRAAAGAPRQPPGCSGMASTAARPKPTKGKTEAKPSK